MNQSGGTAQDALLQRAGEALSRHDPQTALGLIEQADRMGPTHHGFLNRALALRMLGDLAGALAALDEALAIEPYDFTALLGKAAMLEQPGQGRAAADVYRNALKIAPPRDRLPPALQAQLDHASGVVRRQAEALRDHMRGKVAALRSTVDAATLDRFDEGLEIYAGLKTAPKQEPLLPDYPRLPALPFHPRAPLPLSPKPP